MRPTVPSRTQRSFIRTCWRENAVWLGQLPNLGECSVSTTFVTSFKNQLKNNPVFRPLLSGWFGTKFATDLYVRKVVSPYLSILRTGEFHNFTYDLTPTNLNYLWR
jgi:hypothetical protein